MEEPITISTLNDFIFCPRSIYFHNAYGNLSVQQYHRSYQTQGKHAHESLDNKTYSRRKNDILGMSIGSTKYNLTGKIDLFHVDKKLLVERKREIKTIYDGYKFQLYAQYFCLVEMGYEVEQLALHSLVDNKRYAIDIPGESEVDRFEELLKKIQSYRLEKPFSQNKEKCNKCVYSSLCDIP